MRRDIISFAISSNNSCVLRFDISLKVCLVNPFMHNVVKWPNIL